MNKDEILLEIEKWTGLALPSQYRHFLCTHEEKIFGEGVLIYPAEYIIERNETYETKIYCPNYLTIGDDSGGRAFIISLEDNQLPVFVVAHGSMDSEDFELVADSFIEWVKHDCPI